MAYRTAGLDEQDVDRLIACYQRDHRRIELWNGRRRKRRLRHRLRLERGVSDPQKNDPGDQERPRPIIEITTGHGLFPFNCAADGVGLRLGRIAAVQERINRIL